MYRLYSKNMADEQNNNLVFDRAAVVPRGFSLIQHAMPLLALSPGSALLSVPRMVRSLFTPQSHSSASAVIVGAMNFHTERANTDVDHARAKEGSAEKVQPLEGHAVHAPDAYMPARGKDIIVTKKDVKEKAKEKFKQHIKTDPQVQRGRTSIIHEDTAVTKATFLNLQIDTEGTVSSVGAVHGDEGLPAEALLAIPAAITFSDIPSDTPEPVHVDQKGSMPGTIGLLKHTEGVIETFSVASFSGNVPKAKAGVLRTGADVDRTNMIVEDLSFSKTDAVLKNAHPDVVRFIQPFRRNNDWRSGDNSFAQGHETDERLDMPGSIEEVNNSGDQRNTGTGG